MRWVKLPDLTSSASAGAVDSARPCPTAADLWVRILESGSLSRRFSFPADVQSAASLLGLFRDFL